MASGQLKLVMKVILSPLQKSLNVDQFVLVIGYLLKDIKSHIDVRHGIFGIFCLLVKNSTPHTEPSSYVHGKDVQLLSTILETPVHHFGKEALDNNCIPTPGEWTGEPFTLKTITRLRHHVTEHLPSLDVYAQLWSMHILSIAIHLWLLHHKPCPNGYILLVCRHSPLW